MTINKTEKFKLRKSKKYKNLVSVGLGVMTAVAIGVVSDGEAHASNANVTNSNITQPTATNEQNTNLQNANTSTGVVNITVSNSNIQKAVDRAKSEGVNVVEKTQDLGITTSTEETTRKRNEAIEQNKVEENKINEAIDNYKKEKAANQNAINTATQENKEKQAQYEKDLANYNKEKAEKERQNVAIRKENEGINTRNNDKKAEYEENQKRAEKAQKQNEQDLENEKELIVQKGGERESSSNGIKVKEGERIDVQASGNITIKSVNSTETVTDTRLTLTLPNTDIRNGSYIDLKYERLREEQLKDYDVQVNGEKIGTLKLVSIDNTRNADYDPNRKDETYDAYTSMANYNFRLIFNENANKYKNKVVTISSNNTANWNGYYGREKQGVNHNIYVNGTKVVSSEEHNIPATEVARYKDWSNVRVDDTVLGVFINENGEIRPNGMFGKVSNSHEQANTRTNKLTDGDIITYRLDNNSPVKFDPTQKYDAQNMFFNQGDNFGNNINKYGSLIGNGSHLPNVEVLNFTDTELKVKITNVDNKYFSLRADSYKRIPMKITSYNKADYGSDRKYTISATVQDSNGNLKAESNARNSIGISGADVNSIGELKPYVEKEKFKIKVNYVDTSGKVIKNPYGENNLAYGDKYTVNVPSISNYVFVREKDDKILNGVFREDLEYTLVYKKLNNVINQTPPSYETPKPELPLPKEPEQPTTKPIPSEITAPTVGYTTFRLAERPRVFKEARNLDNTNLDNSLVSKNSTVKFTLKVDKLPAGREALNVLEFTDHLPQGYVIDEATVTRENNALGYNTAYDKSNHTVVFSANSTLLNKLNANLNEVVDVVAPTVTGTVTNDGGIYKNNFKINLNNKYTTHSNVVTVNTPNGITPNKVNTNADNSNIDGKIVVAETTNYYKLLWDLDQYKGMKLSRNDIAKGFYYLEDYPEEAVTINNRLVSLVDSNGQAVTGVEVNSYNSLEEAPETVKTMLSKANITPKGAFQLFTATNPTDFYNKYVVTGNSIKITNPMVVKDSLTQTGGVYENKAYQIDLGNGYATETVRNIVPKVDTNKHNYNEDGVLIDGKQVVAGTTNHYKLTWDLDQYRGMSATNSEIVKGFFFVEDYPEEALTVDNTKVTMLDSNGQAVTGVEVSSYNSLENAPEDIKQALVNAKITPKGAFQLFRATNAKDFFNKYVLTGNSITITTPMKVKEELTTTGGTYNNKAYQVDFGKTFETNIVTNIVPKVTPEKHNTNEDGTVVDGKQIVAGTTNYYKLTWDLTPYRGVVPTRNELNKGFFFVEDYPEKEVTIDNTKVTMVDSKGQAVTGVEVSSYNSLEEAPENVKTMLSKANISPKGAFQLFNANSPMDFFNKYASVGNSITITTPMTVKEELTTTGGTIRNKGYQIDFGKGRETETIINEIPKVTPEKHNTNEDGVVVDGKQVVAGTTNYYKLTWDLDQYRDMTATSREVARGFFVVEDYPEEAVTIDNSKVTMVDSNGQAVTGVEVLSYDSVENAPDDIKKALVNAKITPKGAFQLFRATNSRDFFNKYVLTGNSITITTPMTVKEELTTTGGVFNNKMYQVDFGKGREVEHEVTNNIPKVEPTKHNTNEDGVVVDGKVIAPETVNNYKLLWDLDQYRGVVATSRELAKGFYFVEDYPEEALAINNSKVTMVDSKGQAVTGVEVLSYDSVENAPEDIKKALMNAKITPKGAFQVYKATNSREFYDKYVFTGNSITITSPMTMLDSVNKNGAVYNNKAYQIDFGKGRETDVVTNTVPKSNPEKHNYNEDGVLIDGGLVPVGSTTEYKLTWKLSNLRDVVGTNEAINRGFYYIDDYPEVLKTLDDRIKVLDSNGNVVNGIRVTKYDNLEQASSEIKAILSKNNITPKGAFQVFSAENPIEFYNNYVKKGIDLTIVNPMQVTQALKENGGSYQNVAYEIDFGVAQVTDTITNTVPKVKPVKHNYNEDNVKIDGKVVLAGSRTNYKLNWNLSAYKNVNAADKYIEKGFYFVDDYPEEALNLDEKNITITDDKGKAVAGVEVVNYESLEKAPEEVKAVLKEAKVMPKGAFQLFKATDSKQFYNDYVKTGTNLTITNPMTVKPELARKDSKKIVDNISKETENKTVKDVTKVNNSVTTTNTKPKLDKAMNEAVEKENNTLNTISKVSVENIEKDKITKGTGKTTEYKNRGYQIDFGNGYETDVVANNVPKIDPIKDVVIDVKGKESLQGKEIELNKFFNYKLIGTEIPSNRGTKLTQYGFSDDYDEKADKYQANYRVFSMKDIKLTDGSVIKQDSELTKYTTQIMKDGKVDIEFDKEFLDKVDLDSEFQAEVYLQMERIASGEVKNTFIHTVNGVEETSNTVTTLTKEPEKPEEPKQPVPPKVEEKTPNKSTGKVLPNTGVTDNDGTSTAIALTALATAGFIARRKKVKNS